MVNCDHLHSQNHCCIRKVAVATIASNSTTQPSAARAASHSTASNSTASAAFRGDGKYIGDGGALLQALWRYCEWKEIRDCPGRYTVRRRRDLARWPPERLLAAALGGNVPPVGLWRHGSSTSDAIHAVRFAGGGGLLTYARADGTFVHTLNTESGLLRKIAALRVTLEVPQRARCVLGVLAYLNDGEQNAAAYALVRRFNG